MDTEAAHDAAWAIAVTFIDFWKRLACSTLSWRDCPLRYTSPNAPKKRG